MGMRKKQITAQGTISFGRKIRGGRCGLQPLISVRVFLLVLIRDELGF